MSFSRLKLDPTREFDDAGRALWVIRNDGEKPFRWFLSGVGFHAECSVPDGYKTNFASVPRFFWRILPPDGPHREAAIIHDAMYDAGYPSRWLADAIFYEAMNELGVSLWKRLLMWFFVRLFASNAYRGPR